MSHRDHLMCAMRMICAAVLGYLLTWTFLPTKTTTKTKTRTIVCMVDNQQAIASCTRVKKK